MHANQTTGFDSAIKAVAASSRLPQRVEAAAKVAADHADTVDIEARFPKEAIGALKAARLLGVMVPKHLGGEGLGLAEVADLCFALGRACGSTAMIFAMHQVKVACLVNHHSENAWQVDFLRRLARDQLLLGSSTTEGDAGGAVRISSAAIDPIPGGVRLVRAASVVSYGEEADAIVTTARRNADAAASDQVLAVFERADYRLERLGSWNAMGMRGTCSHAFTLDAKGRVDQVLSVAYADIHAQTMTVTAHVVWGSVWAGIASAAVERARLYLRRAAREARDTPPPGERRLGEAKASLQTLCSLLSAFITRHDTLSNTPSALAALDFQTATSLLKVQASELAISTVMSASRVCGLSGYRNDGEASLSRMVRDVLSAPLMISNDRIMADLGKAALLDRGLSSLNGTL